MKLKESIIQRIRSDMYLRIDLRRYLGCSETTIYKRIKRNDPKLTQYDVLKFLASKIGEEKIDNLIEESKDDKIVTS